MKKLFIIFLFIISGCYLANGSPNAYTFWVKDGKKISYAERNSCFEKNKSKLKKETRERFEYLEKRYEELGYSKMKSEHSEEYQEYRDLRKLIPSNANCYYDLGYRFTAPVYWCMAQDGDNARICRENAKYRK